MLSFLNGILKSDKLYSDNQIQFAYNGWFVDDIKEVVKLVKTGNKHLVRGSYRFAYFEDDRTELGTSANYAYPLYVNGKDISDNPLDLNAHVSIDKLKNIFNYFKINTEKHVSRDYNTDIFISQSRCIFDNIEQVLNTELLTEEVVPFEVITHDFLNAISLNTKGKRTAIFFTGGEDSMAILSACKILGLSPTLITLNVGQDLDFLNEMDMPFKVFSPENDIDKVFAPIDQNEIVLPFGQWFMYHRELLKIMQLTEFDVYLGGNTSEMYSAMPKVNPVVNKTAVEVMTRIANMCLTTGTIDRISGKSYLDPYCNLDVTSNVMLGQDQYTAKSLPKFFYMKDKKLKNHIQTAENTYYIHSNDIYPYLLKNRKDLINFYNRIGRIDVFKIAPEVSLRNYDMLKKYGVT